MKKRKEAISEVKIGKLKKEFEKLIYTMKILVFKDDPNLIELLDLDDNNIFTEPLLFAYFNNLPSTDFPPISQLLFGYIHEAKRPKEIKIKFDLQGIAYLPNFGYFKIDHSSPTVPYKLVKKENGIYEIQTTEQYVPHTFIEIQKAADFEILLYNHPLFYQYFSKLFSNGETTNDVIKPSISTLKHLDTLKRAISLIREYCPLFYKRAKLTNKKIILFEYESINSFVTKDIQGAIFTNIIEDGSVAFFIDDLVHQWSHNILNAYVYDKTEYFIVDPEKEKLSTYSKNELEFRDIYDAFHGLYTVAERVNCFQIFRNLPHLFSPIEYKEILARYCDQSRRYRTGLEAITLNNGIYTNSGWDFYKNLDTSITENLTEINDLLSNVNFSNQKSRFSFKNFLELNRDLMQNYTANKD